MLLLSNIAGYDGATMGDKGYLPGVGEGILFVCTVVPAVVYTLVFLLMQFGYPLSKSKLEPVYAHIREKRAAQAQAKQTAQTSDS